MASSSSPVQGSGSATGARQSSPLFYGTSSPAQAASSIRGAPLGLTPRGIPRHS